jgi:outer membrane protein OmpA-like peptidoglycan-associated protein
MMDTQGIRRTLGLAVILTASSISPILAQSTGTTAPATQPAATTNPGDSNSYATGQPLQLQSKEGFWGHVNPFARKKWVKRQLDPVKDRLNELDQLQAKNARDIRDLDARTAAGIRQAQSTADQAGQTASSANMTATQAQQLAQQASGRTDTLGTTVANLDQYQKVNDTELIFHPGQTALNARAKLALGQVATQLQGQKGYVLEVEGFAQLRGSAGITASQHMADAVVRYLVEEHQVPVYRIHQLALGSVHTEGGIVAPKAGSAVRVTVLQNSLAASNAAATPAASASRPGSGAAANQ